MHSSSYSALDSRSVRHTLGLGLLSLCLPAALAAQQDSKSGAIPRVMAAAQGLPWAGAVLLMAAGLVLALVLAPLAAAAAIRIALT